MKKRYMFTLTEEHVEAFRDFAKKANLPAATLSNCIDDFIRDLVQMMNKAMARGSFTLKDLFVLVGEQMELLQHEESNEKSRETAKSRTEGSKPRSKAH